MKIVKFKHCYLSTSANALVIYKKAFNSSMLTDIVDFTNSTNMQIVTQVIYASYIANSRNENVSYEDFISQFNINDFLGEEALAVMLELLEDTKGKKPVDKKINKK